ncbi:MAG: hypothetical protein ACKOYM_00360 [Actinomycetes bacterium]
MDNTTPLGSGTMTTIDSVTSGTTDLRASRVDLRDQPGLAVGDAVEVLSRFDARWLRGFSVAVLGTDAYQLRRLSDGAVLPAWFPASHVRPANSDLS